MGAVAPLATAVRPFIATFMAAPVFPALRSTGSILGAYMIGGGAMGAVSAFPATTSFAAPTTTPELPTIDNTLCV